MNLEIGDIVTSRGDHATFHVQYYEDGLWWWPCHLADGGVWLVLEVDVPDPQSDRIVAKLLSITDLDCKPWWVEGTLEEWCTLDKVN